MRQKTSTAPLSHQHSAHRHAPNCHSRACGDLFIHTCQKPRLEMYSPQQTTTKAKPTATRTIKREKRATALAIRWVPAFVRMTKTRKEKAELSSAAKNKKTQHTAVTPPTVIPAHAGIHSSTRARCRVWKCTCRNKQRRKRSQQQHG